MDPEQDIKWAIGWNRFNLKMVGGWPDPFASDTGLEKYRFVMSTIVMFTFLTAPQSANLILFWGDLDVMTENLATANIPVFNAIMKLLFIRYHRNALKPLVGSFGEDWRRATSDERSTMLKSASIARKISIGCNVLTQVTLTSYVLLRLISIAMIEDRQNTDPLECTLYISSLPYDVRKSPMLELTCVGQVLAAFTVATTYTGVDSFITMLVLHACGQYANLGRALTNLFHQNLETMSRESVRKKMAAIVKRHNHLNWFSATIEDSFSILLLVQMLGCTMQFCLQGFKIFTILMLEDDIPAFELIFLVCYVAFVALHLYFYCYVGEMLLVYSSSIGYSAYDSSWYNGNAYDARSLLLIMHRSTKPMCLTAGKFSTFCLETFSTILKTSMGYLSVLVAVTATGDQAALIEELYLD